MENMLRGLGNATWSDIMLGTIIKSYSHDPDRINGLTFNKNAFHCWEKSLHIFNMMEKSLLDVKDTTETRSIILTKKKKDDQ